MPIHCIMFNRHNMAIDELTFDFERDYFRYLALTKKTWHRVYTLIQTGYDYDGSPTYMEVR